jgi:hypothetical protein
MSSNIDWANTAGCVFLYVVGWGVTSICLGVNSMRLEKDYDIVAAGMFWPLRWVKGICRFIIRGAKLAWKENKYNV